MSDLTDRRLFLRAAVAASASWAMADLAQIEEALAWASQSKTRGRHDLRVLTGDQAEVIDALTSRILPSTDGRPGAHEAGVLYFIDRSLSTFNADQKELYAGGTSDLNRRAADRWKPTTRFAALTPAQQDELLHDIERTPFFQTARFDTIVGAFALPTWGGNHDYAGWRMLGFAHQPLFQPPFGFYDAEVNRKG